MNANFSDIRLLLPVFHCNKVYIIVIIRNMYLIPSVTNKGTEVGATWNDVSHVWYGVPIEANLVIGVKPWPRLGTHSEVQVVNRLKG